MSLIIYVLSKTCPARLLANIYLLQQSIDQWKHVKLYTLQTPVHIYPDLGR